MNSLWNFDLLDCPAKIKCMAGKNANFEEIRLDEIAFFIGVVSADEKMDEFHAMLKMGANL